MVHACAGEPQGCHPQPFMSLCADDVLCLLAISPEPSSRSGPLRHCRCFTKCLLQTKWCMHAQQPGRQESLYVWQIARDFWYEGVLPQCACMPFISIGDGHKFLPLHNDGPALQLRQQVVQAAGPAAHLHNLSRHPALCEPSQPSASHARYVQPCHEQLINWH